MFNPSNGFFPFTIELATSRSPRRGHQVPKHSNHLLQPGIERSRRHHAHQNWRGCSGGEEAIRIRAYASALQGTYYIGSLTTQLKTAIKVTFKQPRKLDIRSVSKDKYEQDI